MSCRHCNQTSLQPYPELSAPVRHSGRGSDEPDGGAQPPAPTAHVSSRSELFSYIPTFFFLVSSLHLLHALVGLAVLAAGERLPHLRQTLVVLVLQFLGVVGKRAQCAQPSQYASHLTQIVQRNHLRALALSQ